MDDIEVLWEFAKEGEAEEEEIEERYQEALRIIDEVEFKATLDKEEDEPNNVYYWPSNIYNLCLFFNLEYIL